MDVDGNSYLMTSLRTLFLCSCCKPTYLNHSSDFLHLWLRCFLFFSFFLLQSVSFMLRRLCIDIERRSFLWSSDWSSFHIRSKYAYFCSCAETNPAVGVCDRLLSYWEFYDDRKKQVMQVCLPLLNLIHNLPNTSE